MAPRKLRAVLPDEQPTRAPTVSEAAQSGDHRALLVADERVPDDEAFDAASV